MFLTQRKIAVVYQARVSSLENEHSCADKSAAMLETQNGLGGLLDEGDRIILLGPLKAY